MPGWSNWSILSFIDDYPSQQHVPCNRIVRERRVGPAVRTSHVRRKPAFASVSEGSTCQIPPDSGGWSREDQLRPSRGRQDRVGPTCPARAISIQEASSTLGTGGLDCSIGLDRTVGILEYLVHVPAGDFCLGKVGRKRNPRKRYKVSNEIFFRFDWLTFGTSRTCGLAVVRVGALGLLGFHLYCTWVHFPTSFV